MVGHPHKLLGWFNFFWSYRPNIWPAFSISNWFLACSRNRLYGCLWLYHRTYPLSYWSRQNRSIRSLSFHLPPTDLLRTNSHTITLRINLFTKHILHCHHHFRCLHSRKTLVFSHKKLDNFRTQNRALLLSR